MSEERKISLISDAPTWGALIVTCAISVASTTAWAYSTFVTIRERDSARQLNNQRVQTLEDSVRTILTGQSELKGKIDSMFLMMERRNK